MSGPDSLQARKQQLRRLVRARRPDEAACAAESRALCEGLLRTEIWQAARTVAAYMPLPHEADVRPLLMAALREGKTLLLPRVAEGRMAFLRAEELSALQKDDYGILTPPAGAAALSPEEIDLMLVPVEALDGRLRRLGKGGGWYDRVLAAGRPCRAAGVLLRHQWVREVPCGAWDQRLDAAVDADGLHLPEPTA